MYTDMGLSLRFNSILCDSLLLVYYLFNLSLVKGDIT